MAVVANESRRYAQRGAGWILLQEGRASGIPGGVASGLEGGTQATGREAGGIRLALDQFFTRKFHQHLALGGGGDEGLVLFGGQAGQRLEPVRVMGGAFLDGPVLHGAGHHLGHFQRQFLVAALNFQQLAEDVLGQAFAHDGVREAVDAENAGDWRLAEIDTTVHDGSWQRIDGACGRWL